MYKARPDLQKTANLHQGVPLEFCKKSAKNHTTAAKKKAHYQIDSALFNAHGAYLVGRAGVEPTTNGLKVRYLHYSTPLKTVD